MLFAYKTDFAVQRFVIKLSLSHKFKIIIFELCPGQRGLNFHNASYQTRSPDCRHIKSILSYNGLYHDIDWSLVMQKI